MAKRRCRDKIARHRNCIQGGGQKPDGFRPVPHVHVPERGQDLVPLALKVFRCFPKGWLFLSGH